MTKTVLFALLAIVTISQIQSAVLPVTNTEVAVLSSETISIDTLGSSRVKRNGGCGCCGCGCGCACGGGGGCGCCCCRPKCCCRRCCTCCRTCCCTRFCTCCRPCCCGCGCGCGCCGCGGGRKRRSLQKLRIDEENRALGIKRKPSKAQC